MPTPTPPRTIRGGGLELAHALPVQDAFEGRGSRPSRLDAWTCTTWLAQAHFG